MAVYTHLGAEVLAELIAAYDVGDLISAKGIAEGVSNSNWMIETAQSDGRHAQFILTLYERRIDIAELPFFLSLLDHLAARGCAVPATIHDRAGASLRQVSGKAAALIEFLPGVSPSAPSPEQAYAVGAALAQVHIAGRDFPHARRDRLTPTENRATLVAAGPEGLRRIDKGFADAIDWAGDVVTQWPTGLPASIIHSDLFPDNVLMLGSRVTGMIDFYFACSGMMAYDLAVAHAAWAFDGDGSSYSPSVGTSLIAGYDSVRALTPAERAALPLLAQGACLRFTASRAEDWLDPAAAVTLTRKNPMDFLRRWRFYRENGAAAFANP